MKYGCQFQQKPVIYEREAEKKEEKRKGKGEPNCFNINKKVARLSHAFELTIGAIVHTLLIDDPR